MPDGYDGIAVDRGKIEILKGGIQHHLSHVGIKFVKMIPKIIQTDKLTSDIVGYIQNLENKNQERDSVKIAPP